MSDIVVVDGNNLAHKCKHSFSLTTPDGMDCSVTYGFLSVLKSYINEFDTTACIVAWDGGIPQYRREAVEEYKANRSHGDPLEYQDFLRQLRDLDGILGKMGVLSVRRPYCEADDLLYHAAQMTFPFYDTVAVVSSDKDLLQVVNISKNTFVWNPDDKELRGRAWLRKEYGIEPQDYTHWRALQGDSSDNVQGVRGIGPKTATKLFNKYNSLPGIINAAMGDNPKGEITGATGDRINSFGADRLTKNVYVMALAFDRAGARHTLWQAIQDFQEADIKYVKHWLLDRAFTSLAHVSYYKLLRKLSQPQLDTNMKMPIVCNERDPADGDN